RRWRQEDQRDQGSPLGPSGPRPEGSQGPGRRRSAEREGKRFQAGSRRSEEEAGRSRRLRHHQVSDGAGSALLKIKKGRGATSGREQAASFMACGYAMYTDKLGVCFGTAGPGAFNLSSGLAVAMSDSYPVLAVSGFANLDWRGKGSLNETSGLARTPDSQAM